MPDPYATTTCQVTDAQSPSFPDRVSSPRGYLIVLALPPFRATQLMPLEALWRQLKAPVAATRPHVDLDELFASALTWLTTMTPLVLLYRCCLASSKVDWIFTLQRRKAFTAIATLIRPNRSIKHAVERAIKLHPGSRR